MARRLKEQERYYLKSILNHLREVRDYINERSEGPSIGMEVLADNIDWLDCYIDARTPRKQ